MKNFTHIKTLLVVLLVNVVSDSMSQTNIRPYELWDETAFVSLSGHQPANYVRKDNNWEILYTLRTPHTIEELNNMGIFKSARGVGYRKIDFISRLHISDIRRYFYPVPMFRDRQ